MHHRSRVTRVVAAALAGAALLVPALSTARAAAGTTTIDGPDVASYQHPTTSNYPHGKPINWSAVAADGKEFAIVKATEGTTYTNPFFNGKYGQDYPDSLAAGLVHGAYHFARPALPVVASAQAQAEYFASVVGAVNTAATLPPALDLEVTGGLSRAQLVTWAQTFLYRLRVLTGRTPMLYTYPNFWTSDLADPGAFSRFPLWMASYGTSTAPTADLWQYTDAASVSGIPGKVDLSKFLGDDGLPWTTLSDGTVAAPWAIAAPSAPHGLTVTPGPGTATVSWMPGSDGSSRTTGYTVIATTTTSVNPSPSPTPTPTIPTPTPTPTPSPTTTPTPPAGSVSTHVNGASTSATVTGLDPDLTYTFSVYGTNSVGAGMSSAQTAPIQPIVSSGLTLTQRPGVAYGKPLIVSATLTRADTDGTVAGQRVRVYRRGSGTTTWVRRTTLTTDSTGAVSTTLHPHQSVDVKLVFPGGSGYRPATATATTLVRPVVTAALSAPKVRHGTSVELTGGVTPVVAGQALTLQVYSAANGWTTDATSTAGTDGTYSFTLRPPHKQRARLFRVKAAATHGRGVGTSPVASLRVT